MTYSSIVVGTDGSETAARAVSEAATMAVADGARLIVVTAYTPDSEPGADVAPDAVPEDLRHLLTDRVQAEERAGHGRDLALAGGAKGVVVQALEGDPAEVLLDTAKEFSADLIVVGSRGLGRTAHFILGSVAATVAHHAPCDVLVAHTTS